MNIDDILTLVNAGFTKADILAFAAGTQPTQQEPEPVQQDPEPTQQEPEPVQQDPGIKEALDDVKKTLALMQKANLQNASQPTGANQKQTPEDVWKNFFERDEK